MKITRSSNLMNSAVIAGVALASVVMTVAQAKAALLTYEGFDYAAGASMAPSASPFVPTANGQTGGTGWSSNLTNTSTATGGSGTTYTTVPNGAWQDSAAANPAPSVSSGSLVYTSGLNTLATTGNSMSISYGNHSGVVRQMGASVGTPGTTIWMSVLANYTGSVSDGRYFRMSLFNGTTSVLDGIGKNGTNWTFAGATGSTPITQNATALLLTQIVYNLDGSASMSLFVNPALDGTLGAATATRTFAIGAAPIFDSIRLQSNGTGIFDEVRVGTTLADVIPVPEPSAFALFASGLGFLFLRRGSKNRQPA